MFSFQYPGGELLGHRVCECFMRNCAAFFPSGCTILHCLHLRVRVPVAPHPVSFRCCQSFSYSGGCEVASHCSFTAHRSDGQWCWASCRVLLTIGMCSSEVLVEIFCSLKIGFSALAGVARWIECWPVNQRVAGLIPSQGTCLVCGSGPQLGACKK